MNFFSSTFAKSTTEVSHFWVKIFRTRCNNTEIKGQSSFFFLFADVAYSYSQTTSNPLLNQTHAAVLKSNGERKPVLNSRVKVHTQSKLKSKHQCFDLN